MENNEINIDLSYLSELASDNTEFMVEMIDLFLTQTPDYVASLADGFKQKDFTAIANAAHKIKPTLTFMGVDSIRETMTNIETLARKNQDYEEILASFNSMQSLFPIIYSKLEEKKQELIARG